jgi:hypothetical protein
MFQRDPDDRSFGEETNMPDNPPRPPDPKPGSEWDWEDEHGKKRKLGLCLEGLKRCKEPKPQNEEIWCQASELCDVKDKPCQCWLFWAKKGSKEWEPMPMPKKKYKYDEDYFYACFCVRILTPNP